MRERSTLEERGGLVPIRAALVPGVFEPRPPYSESPSGLIVIFVRGEALAILGMAAVATMVAAAIPSGWRGADPAD